MNMLGLSLGVSVLLLVIANFEARRSYGSYWSGSPLFLKVMCIPFLLPCCLTTILPLAVLQAVLLGGLIIVAQRREWRPLSFLWASGGVTLGLYVVAGGWALHHVNQLLERYPLVSLEERLPVREVRQQQELQQLLKELQQPLPEQPLLEKLLSEAALPEAASSRLLELNDLVEKQRWLAHRHSQSLKWLHEHTLDVFVNQPAFGVGRMASWMYGDVSRSWKRPEPLPQPGKRLSFAWSSGDLEVSPPALPPEDFRQNWQMHMRGLVDFSLSRGGFYFKDRRHVAGFEGHQFNKPLEADKPWTLQTVDLLGLVVHDKPVVYITEQLPNMEEVRDAPLRAPDDFEIAGLRALNAGEDLYVRDAAPGRRMLGAIRNGMRCLECHGGMYSELLGAFSYTLSR